MSLGLIITIIIAVYLFSLLSHSGKNQPDWSQVKKPKKVFPWWNM